MPWIHAGGNAPGHRVLGRQHHGRGPVGGRARLEVAQRVPQHHRVLDHLHVDVGQVQVGVGVAHGVLAVLDRHHPPDVVGGARAAHVGPDVGGEVAAGPGQQRGGEGLGHRQRPHGVGVRLLLVGHGQHPLVDARRDQVGGHQGGRPPHRAGGVHPEHGLAHRAEGRGQVQLGHHVALEHVRGLADDHGVDVRPGRGRRRPGPSWPPPGPGRRWTRRPAWPCGGSGPRR